MTIRANIGRARAIELDGHTTHAVLVNATKTIHASADAIATSIAALDRTLRELAEGRLDEDRALTVASSLLSQAEELHANAEAVFEIFDRAPEARA